MRLRKIPAGLLAVLCAGALPARRATVDFETREGTRLAFDLSPDGRTIAFDLLGQIWTLPATGGTATPITFAVRDTTEDIDPVFSPDGKWIAFQADRPTGRELWLVPTEGGAPRQLSREQKFSYYAFARPAWSPDGREIAFAARDTLFRIRVGDGVATPVRLDSVPAAGGRSAIPRVSAPAWSPDGSRIAFVNGTDQRIWAVPREGGAATALTPERVAAVAPAWSPDGSRLAFFVSDSVAQPQLWIQEISGNAPRRVTDQVQVVNLRVRWTAGGDSLVYSAAGRLWRAAVSGGEPVRIPFTARVHFERKPAVLPPILFAEPGTDQPARGFSGLALSADGKTIAMIALGKLWTFAPGAAPHEVTALPFRAGALSWSPAGDHVVYSAGAPGAEALFVTRIEDGRTRRVTALAGREFYPTWSPDGARIAFVHQSGAGDPVVRVVSAAGGVVPDTLSARGIAPWPGWWIGGQRPVWLPDSKGLLLYRNAILQRNWGWGAAQAHIVLLDGRRRALGRFPGAPTYLNWGPNGSIIYVEGNQLWRAAFSADSGMLSPPSAVSGRAALHASAAADGRTLVLSHDGLAVIHPGGRADALGWPLRFRIVPAATSLVLRNVRIIDGTGAPATAAQDMLIENGRIHRISSGGRLAAPPGASVLEAAGRTVIPGLIDLHAHIWGDDVTAGFLFEGVTTVRDVGSPITQTADLANATASGQRPGSRVTFGGMLFNNGPGISEDAQQFVSDSGAIDRGIQLAKGLGAVYIKHRAFEGWTEAVRTVTTAHRYGLPVSGHCSHQLPVVAAGVDGREHSGDCFRDVAPPYEDQIKLTGEAGMWVVPDPAFYEPFLRLAVDSAWLSGPEVALFFTSVSRALYAAAPASQRAAYARNNARRQARAKAFHDAGVPLGVGTDGNLPNGVQMNLEALVRSGLTPMEAITAATGAAARILRAQDEIGTIKVGKRADLVILDADPLLDIRNTSRIWNVIQDGRIVDRPGLLAWARKHLQP
jgi:Tol biopolymer transport system component